jgi:hypothetical protein
MKVRGLRRAALGCLNQPSPSSLEQGEATPNCTLRQPNIPSDNSPTTAGNAVFLTGGIYPLACGFLRRIFN